MTLTDALLLLAFLLANMAIGGTTLFLSSSVEAVLAKRHPDIWAPMQGYALSAREARARFFLSGAPYRLNDPDLARAVTRYWMATAAWLAFMIVTFVVMAARR
jgi:hypothetical protein